MDSDQIKAFYDSGAWDAKMVADAAKRGFVGRLQVESITGMPFAKVVLLDYLKQCFVFSALENNDRKNSITTVNSTVTFNTVNDVTINPTVTPETVAVSVSVKADHESKFDINTPFADVDVVDVAFYDKAMKATAAGIKTNVEAYMLPKLYDGSGEHMSAAIPTGGIYELLIMLKASLDDVGAPADGRFVVTSHYVLLELMFDARFVAANNATSGHVPHCAGFDIYTSLNELVADKMIVGHVDSIAAVYKINCLQSSSAQTYGNVILGATVTKPNWLKTLQLTG